MENLTNDTPPKNGFWTPPRTVRFPPPSGVSALFFLYRNPRQSRPEALLEGSKNFRESAFSATFSSPRTFSMESQTHVSKRAPREFQNWRVQGNPLTLRQPLANPLPTLRQPFANPLPTFSPLQPPLSVAPRCLARAWRRTHQLVFVRLTDTLSRG